MKAEDLYVGEAGAHYYAGRVGRRATPVQKSRAILFEDVVTPTSTALDFGCGNGGVLQSLAVKRRIGIEISELAAAEAAQCLDEVHERLDEVADESVDVVISCHALEHVDAPADVVREMHRILRPGGLVRILVPCDMPLLISSQRRWSTNDPDMHLFGWTPQTLGNLVHIGGFREIDAEMIPDSNGGRLSGLFAPGTKGRYWASLLKALRTGRFHTCVTARKP